MKKTVIMKTGNSIPSLVARRGDFEDWIIAGIERDQPFSGSVISVHRNETPPDHDRISGIIVTGSHAMVTDGADWSERTAKWLAEVVRREIPVLGICFGHQILAYALEGRVASLPGGPEFGTVSLTLTDEAMDDPLFGNLPRMIEVQSSHYQAVTDLPPGSVRLAFTAKDPNSAFRYGRCAWGVQFHPEYDAEIANAYAAELNRQLRESAGNGATIRRNCRETGTGRIILGRFTKLMDNAMKPTFERDVWSNPQQLAKR